MARTLLASMLQDIAVEAGGGDAGRSTRRDFLRRGAVAGAGLTALGQLATPARAVSSDPKIVIVGAGLAGLT
jgi:hypothetical protein